MCPKPPLILLGFLLYAVLLVIFFGGPFQETFEIRFLSFFPPSGHLLPSLRRGVRFVTCNVPEISIDFAGIFYVCRFACSFLRGPVSRDFPILFLSFFPPSGNLLPSLRRGVRFVTCNVREISIDFAWIFDVRLFAGSFRRGVVLENFGIVFLSFLPATWPSFAALASRSSFCKL